MADVAQYRLEGNRSEQADPALSVEAAAVLTDEAGVVCSFSPGAERLFGCPAWAANGRRLSDFVCCPSLPIPAGPEITCGVSRVEGRRPDGTLLPLEMTLSRVPVAGQCVVTATFRELATTPLTLSLLPDEKYRQLFEESPQPMWVFDAKTLRFLAVNDAAVRTYGYSRDEFREMTVWDIRAPEDVPAFREHFHTWAGRGAAPASNYHGEWRHRRKDGSPLWAEIASHPLVYEGRDARLVVVTDVTARRRTDEALRESEQRLRAVVASAPLLLFAIDREGVFTLTEGHALEILERQPGEAVGDSIFERYKDDPQVLADARRALDGEPVHTLWNTHGRFFDIRYTTLRDERGEVSGAIGVGVDVTERWHVERELRDAREDLERRVQERTADYVLANDFLQCAIEEHRVAEQALKESEQAILDLNASLVRAYDATIEGWSRALDLRDHETEGHTQRVTDMTLRLAESLGLPEADLVHIRRGALLHDIGKMGIPDSVLLKPGPLTEDEWAIMRLHPTYAREMLAPITFLEPALDIPYSHHERWDGSGYPRGLKGEQISLPARIFAVADVWDALRSDRPYRKGWPAPRVREYIEQLAGVHFDPTVVGAFLPMVEDREGV